ncbi:MAG: methyltransferase domain-containing protein [Thermodesulfobacteriota bacterium]
MKIPDLLCPTCRQDLEKLSDKLVCNHCRATFPVSDGVISLFHPATDRDSFSNKEAMAHDESAVISAEFMGLSLHYNEKLHTSIHGWISKLLSPGQKILELGSGIGRDIVAIAEKDFHNLHASDVSLKSIRQAQKLAEQKGLEERITFYHLDGSQSLPFKDKEFDAVFMIATLHHFKLAADALREIKRCCSPGGYIMVFMEPNCLYYRCIRPIAKRIENCFAVFRHTHYRVRSIAEETSKGLSVPLIRELANQAGLELVAIQSHWILTGFIYLLQQFSFRIRGKNYPTLLNALSKMTCKVDDWLTKKGTSFCWLFSFIFKT